MSERLVWSDMTAIAADLLRNVLAKPYPPATRGTVVVWGALATFPFGGMTWQVLNNVAGFRRLGFDVWYVVDSDQPVFSATTYLETMEVGPNIAYVDRYMEALGLRDRWIFREPGTKHCSGARDYEGLMDLYREADVVFNLGGAQEARPEHDVVRCLVYLQTDPVAEQVAVAKADKRAIKNLDRYDYLFTYGTNLGQPDSRVPMGRYRWRPTRPPVCIDWWEGADPPSEDAALTTIAKWRHTGKDVVWRGETWHWSKDSEFEPYFEVAARAPLPLEMAVSSIGDDEVARLRQNGWRVIPSATAKDPPLYRSYIRGSLGEFSVAKEQYVRPKSGWFSDRTVCYLAAGRPVVVQATGFENHLPVGEGLLAFSNADEAVAAIQSVASDYDQHRRAAHEIAREYLSAERVLGDLVSEIGL